MLKKITGVSLYNIYLRKSTIYFIIVAIAYLFYILSNDLKSEGVEQIGVSINMFGFITLYSVSVFANDFFRIIGKERLKLFLKTVNLGLPSLVVTKYLTDLIMLLINTAVTILSILFFLNKNDINIKLNFFFGIIWAFEIVLFNNGFDNLIRLIYDKVFYKVLMALFIGAILLGFCILYYNFPQLFNLNFFSIIIISIFNILIYMCLCIFAKKKIVQIGADTDF